MQYCIICGTELPDKAKFCGKCGSNIEMYPQPGHQNIPNVPNQTKQELDPRIVSDIKLSKIVAVGVLVFGVLSAFLTLFTWVETGDIFERKNYMYYTLEYLYNDKSNLDSVWWVSFWMFLLWGIFVLFAVLALVQNRRFYLRLFLSGLMLLCSICTSLYTIIDKSELEYDSRLTSIPFVFLGCAIIYFLGTVIVADIGYRHFFNRK